MKYYILQGPKEPTIVVEVNEKEKFQKSIPATLYEVSDGKIYVYPIKIDSLLLRLLKSGKLDHYLYHNLHTACDISAMTEGKIKSYNLDQNTGIIEQIKTLNMTLEEKINVKKQEEATGKNALYAARTKSFYTSMIILIVIIGVISKASNMELSNYINYLAASPQTCTLHALFVAASILIKKKQYNNINEAKETCYWADYYLRGYQDDYILQKAYELTTKSKYEQPQVEIINDNSAKERIPGLTAENQLRRLKMILAELANMNNEPKTNYTQGKAPKNDSKGYQKKTNTPQ